MEIFSKVEYYITTKQPLERLIAEHFAGCDNWSFGNCEGVVPDAFSYEYRVLGEPLPAGFDKHGEDALIVLLNDLCSRGIIEPGVYTIDRF